MKNKTSILFTLICCLYFLFSSYGYGQSTQLTYKIKGKTTYNTSISFANVEGNTEILPAEYINSAEIYFVLMPISESSKDLFREDDVSEILSKICIEQGEKKVNQSALPKNILNDKGKIESIIIAFSKKEFKDYNSFTLSVEDFSSEEISVKENYFLSFNPQKSIYEQGLSKIEKKDFLGAYSDFMQIFENAKRNPEIKSFSFYQPILSQVIPKTIDIFIEAESSTFNALNDNFLKDKTISSLNKFDSFVKSTSKNIENFNPYLTLEGYEISDYKNKINIFLKTLSEQNQKNNIAFEQEMMLFFEQSNYEDYKFSLFIDLISKMLLHKNSFSFNEKLEPINSNLLLNFPESKNELSGEWGEDFNIYIKLINKNIEQSGVVFKKEVMDNLLDLSSTQKQPYFEIISAFNLLNTDVEIFKGNLKSALAKISDEIILDYVECQLLSIKLQDEGISTSLLAQLDEGVNLIQKQEYNQADETFNLLMRMANQYAPVWYFSGKIKHSLGESYSAERFFKKALEIYPEYIAPRKYIINIFENDTNYAQVLENANYDIEIIDIWYFRYKRALAYYHLKKYAEAITEITQECLKLNSWNIDQYFLLGDAYLAINDLDKAKETYEKTLDINPFSTDSKKFDDRMKVVYEKLGEKK